MHAAKYRIVRRTTQTWRVAAPTGQEEAGPRRGTSRAAPRDVSGTDVSPRCSVVIPTYNRAHSVGDAITSVLRQTMDDLECIVVDDGSTDATPAVLRSFADARLHVILGRHVGVAAARNLGVAHARAPLIAFLDSDDLWRADKLAHEVPYLERHPEVDAVFSDLEKQDGGRVYPSFMRETAVFSRVLGEREYPDGVALSRREVFLVLLEEVPIKPSALTLRRSAFDKAGRFDETWSSSEDWEFLLRFARAHRFAYIDLPLAVLRVGDDSLHRIDQVRGDSAMIRLLLRERALLHDDREARTAVQRGLVTRVKHFGWHHRDAGRRRAAVAVFLRGFAITFSPGLLVRALAALLDVTSGPRTRPIVRASDDASSSPRRAA
jgi:glycosyltransferase involved in cell wall biosynthesis